MRGHSVLLAERGLASMIMGLVQCAWFLYALLPMLPGTGLCPPIQQSHLLVSVISIVLMSSVVLTCRAFSAWWST